MKESLRPGYGQRLAQARAGKEMSAADVAAKLKLTVRQVEALEAEDQAHLPADVFLRGFVRNYARLVDLDPADLIAPLDAQAAVAETITARSEGLSLNKGGMRRWVILPVVSLGIFVLLVAVLYQWLRQGEEALVPEVAVRSGQTEQAHNLSLPVLTPVLQPPQAVPSTASPGGETGTEGQPAASPSQAPGPVPAAAPPAAASDSPPKAAVPAKAEIPPKTDASPTTPAGPSASGSHVLRFQAAQDAWIQVVDGEGRRFSKLVRAGSGDSITGAPPFKLVVGEAAQVRLIYDGQPIDLTPFIGQKVARLTLE